MTGPVHWTRELVNEQLIEVTTCIYTAKDWYSHIHCRDLAEGVRGILDLSS